MHQAHCSAALLALLVSSAATYAATFGTVVPIRGTASDIALDEGHGNLYIANFSAGRIETLSIATRALGAPMIVPNPPSSVAMSPDNRFLVVGEYQTFQGNTAPRGGFSIFDLDANQRQDVTLANAVLAVAFGAGSQALLVTPGGFFLLDPQSGNLQSLLVQPLPGVNLPVPFATF